MKKIFCLLLLSLLGCSSTTVPQQKSNLTVGVIKSEVVKGSTTQTEILGIFGAPNMITKNRADNEVWSYNKMSSESTQKSGFENFLLVGSNSALSTSTTSSFDWIITFDENDIVEDYSLISSVY